MFILNLFALSHRMMVNYYSAASRNASTSMLQRSRRKVRRRCSPALLGLLDIQFGFRFRLRLRFFWHGGPRSKWIEYICPKTCMARTGPAMTRRKDRYQPRAASASQPKMLKTYACARDCTPRRRVPRSPRRAPCGRHRHLVRGASAIGRDRLTTEERLSDIVGNLGARSALA